jgi:hypothetical protein
MIGALPDNTYQTFGITTNNPNLKAGELQQRYGFGYMPMFQFVNRIATGTQRYDPNSISDQSNLNAYARFEEQHGKLQGVPSAAEIAGEFALPVATKIGSSIGGALVDPGITGTTGERAFTGFKNVFSGNPIDEALKASRAATAAGQSLDFATKFPTLGPEAVESVTQASAQGGILGRGPMIAESFDFTSPVGKANIASAAGGAFGNFAVQLAMGADPAKAAKSAGASAIFGTIGGAIGGPFGRFLGNVLGGAVGGRVICNELYKQGLLPREYVIMDYRFTRDYLTPQHVKGYHIWAVWVVKQMRKGKMVKLWKHIAEHRANEIAYIYGKREKPDYLGKIYRKVGEPVCWLLGNFAKATDWSILYKEKEI